MDSKIPFTSYDFWAYLSAGFLLLFAVDHILGTAIFLRPSWTVVQGIVLVSSAYAVGHLIASLSSLVLEQWLVARVLGPPRTVLFGAPRASGWLRRLLPAYFRPLPEETCQAALAKGMAIGVDGPGEALFLLAFQKARASSASVSRLDTFQNLYGFCRNIAVVGFIDGFLLIGANVCGGRPPEMFYWGVAALLFGVGMTLRYLKFYRHYSVEVFRSLAYAS